MKGIGKGGGDQPSGICIGGQFAVEDLCEIIQVLIGMQRVPGDIIGTDRTEVHVEVLLDIRCPGDGLRQCGIPGIVVQKVGRGGGAHQGLALCVVDIADKIQVGFWFFQGEAIVEITADIIGAVEIHIGGGLAAFGIGRQCALDVVDGGACVDRGEYDILRSGVKGRIQEADAMGELRSQVLISPHIVDIVKIGRASCRERVLVAV